METFYCIYCALPEILYSQVANVSKCKMLVLDEADKLLSQVGWFDSSFWIYDRIGIIPKLFYEVVK